MYCSLQSLIGSISSWSSQSLAPTIFISSQNSVELTSISCCRLRMQTCNLSSPRQVSPGFYLTTRSRANARFPSIGNAPRLEQLLGSVPHYINNGALLTDQKVGFAVINRLVQVWIPGSTATNGASQTDLPEFKHFVYERVVPLGLQLPVRQDFDYSDAQAYQVRWHHCTF
jgi:hypothetical protein